MARTVLLDHIFDRVGDHFLAKVAFFPRRILPLIPVCQHLLGSDTRYRQRGLAIGSNSIFAKAAQTIFGPIQNNEHLAALGCYLQAKAWNAIIPVDQF
jgi:hypothetical protein